MWRLGRLALLFLTLLIGFSLHQNPFANWHDSSPPPPIPKSVNVEKWQLTLGNKIQSLRKAIPTASRVVLVPDTATFLQAIQQWNLQQRYPILIEDDRYTPLFLNRFQPEEIIRLSSVKQSLPFNLKTAMENAVATAWESDSQSLQQTWQKLGWEPPGVVITSVQDPAWVAAVALAADRGQPLQFLEGYYGDVNQTLSARGFKNLKQEINFLVERTGYEYRKLGDAIDTLTLARTLPVKYRSPNNHELRAVTDGIARKDNGNRYAIAGWIYGSPERALYQAMAAIFLDSETALLYDSYPKTSSWQEYQFEPAIPLLKQAGLNVQHIEQPNASQKTWQDITSQSWNYDLAFINSRGGKANFAVGDGNASVEDIPQLNVPTAMHFLHSFSATTPNDIDTIAGRWLNHGVYAYVGSVDEPYVSGFVPPKYILARLSLNIPFLAASRYIDAPPWKITAIGDPLMVINGKFKLEKEK